jgi:hypothetical protein
MVVPPLRTGESDRRESRALLDIWARIDGNCWMARALLIAGWLLAVAGAAGADEEEQARISELEQRNARLEERIERLENRDGMPAPVDPLEEDIEEFLAEGLGLNLVIRNGNVTGIFQLFGDVGADFQNPEVGGRGHAFFHSGTVDLFFTVRAGDHFQALSETVFLTRFDEPRDVGGFDQERLWAAWRFSDFLQVKIGLEHGAVSRWNQQFHHGRWLEITIARPLIARFEGDGGILPMHNAGIEFSGTLRSDAGRFNYVLFVSNGRGRVATDTQEFSDRNDGKAVDLLVGFAPESVSGLWVGLVWRVDDMPANPSDPARQRSIREIIGGFQVDFRRGKFETLFEFVYFEDRDRQSGSSFEHYAGYFQLAYRVDDQWVPYFRIDFREMDVGDPYFMPLNRDLDMLEALLGVRYNFQPNAAVKFEVGFGEYEQRDGGGGVRTRGYIRIGLQVAWVF